MIKFPRETILVIEGEIDFPSFKKDFEKKYPKLRMTIANFLCPLSGGHQVEVRFSCFNNSTYAMKVANILKRRKNIHKVYFERIDIK